MDDEQRLSALELKCGAIDVRLRDLETNDAVANERQKQVLRDLSEVKSTLTWLNRLMIGGIVLGIITFIVKGGLVI